MDVILDSNIYIADYEQKGGQFQELFDYLRRTQSNLVLLGVVREEVIARYESELRDFYEQLQRMSRRLGVNRVRDDKGHVLLLNKRLMEPTSDLKTLFYDEYLDFGVEDVIRRGARRIRPANSKGEELRDVIVWLTVLQYAHFKHKAVAFITKDSKYWEGDEPHSDIKADIVNKQVCIEIFRQMSDFLKAKMPLGTALDEQWVEGHLSPQTLSTAAREKALSQIGSYPFVWRSDVEPDLKFVGGNLYSSGPQTGFAELTYDCQLPVEGHEAFSRWLNVAGGSVPLAGLLKAGTDAIGVLTGQARIFVRLKAEKIVSTEVYEFRNLRIDQLKETS